MGTGGVRKTRLRPSQRSNGLKDPWVTTRTLPLTLQSSLPSRGTPAFREAATRYSLGPNREFLWARLQDEAALGLGPPSVNWWRLGKNGNLEGKARAAWSGSLGTQRAAVSGASLGSSSVPAPVRRIIPFPSSRPRWPFPFSGSGAVPKSCLPPSRDLGSGCNPNWEQSARLRVGAGRGVFGNRLEERLPKGSSPKAASGRPQILSRAPGTEHVLFIPTEDAGGQKK